MNKEQGLVSPEIEDIKLVWVAWNNTDLTEGRGAQYPEAVCELRATAKRLGKGRCVMGSDCPLEQCLVVRVDRKWLAPVLIHQPSEADRREESRRVEKQGIVEKAKQLGLSDAEIASLRSAQ